MLFRSALLICVSLLAVACSKDMKVKVAPPTCTVNEKTDSDCDAGPKEPSAMTDEAFFQRKN